MFDLSDLKFIPRNMITSHFTVYQRTFKFYCRTNWSSPHIMACSVVLNVGSSKVDV